MDKEELKQLLKDNLSLNISSSSSEYGCSGDITIRVEFDGEQITSDSISGSDIEMVQPNDYEG